jgi:hypothetical protein
MTEQQIEEKKAEQEVFNSIRAIRRKNRKLRELMGDAEYDDYISYVAVKAEEDYCRVHPGVHVVKVGDGFMLMDIGDSSQEK